MSSVDLYAVMGNPVKHSKSPVIHRSFAEQTHQELEYKALLVAKNNFAQAVQSFFEQGCGLNVTVPFKQDACNLAGKLSERAQLAGAVNTLWRDAAGELVGDNTDGIGLVTDIVQNQGINLQGKRILLLGAGGAVRGVLHPLLAEQPNEVVIANRTPGKAIELASIFSTYGKVTACAYGELEGVFDVVINGTSASLHGDLPPLSEGLISTQTFCYDMMYGAEVTAFNRWAEIQGAAQCVDGLGMLVEQAAESFFLWRGVRPATVEVLQSLRKQLSS